MQIFALVPEIFNFRKSEKYANEKTDDITHSTQYDIKYVNRAILANLQHRSIKFGRLIALQETRLQLFDFTMLAIFSSKTLDEATNLS